MSRSRIPDELRESINIQFHFRCAYCQSQQQISGVRMTVDHIVPESLGGATDKGNLCLACWDCNLRKAVRISVYDDENKRSIRLFHPQNQKWSDHFIWSEDGTRIESKTTVGRATIKALQLNRVELIVARKLWTAVGWHPPNET